MPHIEGAGRVYINIRQVAQAAYLTLLTLHTHSHTPTNSPPLCWASALDLLTVSALGSRVGWTPARNNERTDYDCWSADRKDIRPVGKLQKSATTVGRSSLSEQLQVIEGQLENDH